MYFQSNSLKVNLYFSILPLLLLVCNEKEEKVIPQYSSFLLQKEAIELLPIKVAFHFVCDLEKPLSCIDKDSKIVSEVDLHFVNKHPYQKDILNGFNETALEPNIIFKVDEKDFRMVFSEKPILNLEEFGSDNILTLVEELNKHYDTSNYNGEHILNVFL